MHFIPSGHHTSSHICNHIYHKNLQHNFPKMRVGGGRRPFEIFPKIHPIWCCHPSQRTGSFTKQGLTTDSAAGGLKDVVALPRLLDLSPRGGCACGHTSATGVTHAGEHQSLEQTCIPDSTRAAPRLHGLAFLSSTSYFYPHTPALENPKQEQVLRWLGQLLLWGGWALAPSPSLGGQTLPCVQLQARPLCPAAAC